MKIPNNKIFSEFKKQYYCPEEYQILNEKKCVKNNNVKNIIGNVINYNSKNKEEEIKYYDTILKNIEDFFTSDNFDTSDLDNGNNQIIELEQVKITFTTTQNQKNNINDNMTNIDLGECEKSLRQAYNLSSDEIIYLKIIEKKQEGMRIPKIEYDIYSKLSGDNLKVINLTACQNDKIYTSVPVKITGNLDKLNSSSDYYNDVCYTATSESGTDISVKDRKNEYPNLAVCQDDCDFLGYNYTTGKAKCSCEVKQSSESFKDMNINKQKLLDNFKNIKNIANVKLLICVKVLFSKIGIIKNVGFFILISIGLIHLIALFVFYINQSKLLNKKIKDIMFAIKNLKLIKEDKIKEEKKKVIKENKSKKKKKIKIKKEPENTKNIIRLNKINNNLFDDFNNIYNEVINNDKKISLKKKGKPNKNKKRYKSTKKENKTLSNNNKSDKIITFNLPFHNKNIITNINKRKNAKKNKNFSKY